MTYLDVVEEVAADLGVPDELMRRALQFAVITNPHTLRMSNKKLRKKDEHIARMYFRALLYKIATDPEYRKQLGREIKKQVERN